MATTINLPIFGPSYADCDKCELEPRCRGPKGRPVPGLPAIKNFNGLMIIGEGPGANEATAGVPFVGASGQVLDDLLEAAGIKRHETHITNATLGYPPAREKEEKSGKAKTLHARFPNAIYSCLPRLEAEIEYYKPRVILTLGAAALTAATGYVEKKNRHVPLHCAHCDPKTRKIQPAIECATGTCDWHYHWPGLTDVEALEKWIEGVDWNGQTVSKNSKCPRCEAKLKNLKIRAIKCPFCGGKKKRVESYDVFKNTYGLLGTKGVAGALWKAADLPARWDELGVRYVICTLHPSYMLRSGGKDDKAKGLVGQFAALAALDHLEKAKRLLKRDAYFNCSVRITDDAREVEEFIADSIRDHGPEVFELDIETNAKSPWDVSELRCIGIGRPDLAEVLVVDTRRMLNVTVIDENEGKPEGTPHVPLRFEIEVIDDALHGVLCRFLTDPAIPKSAQNGAYDYIVLCRLMGIEVGPIGADTKAAHTVLRPDEPHTLSHIAAGLTESEYWKQPKEVSGEQQWASFKDLAIYNGKDVKNTSLARESMVGRYHRSTWIAPTGVEIESYTRGGRVDHPDIRTRMAYDVDMAMLPITIEMESTGIPVSIEALADIEREKRPEWTHLRDEMQRMVGRIPEHVLKSATEEERVLNLNSSQQMAWVLYANDGPCKLTAPGVTKTGAPSADKDALAKLGDHPFVQMLLKWRAIDSIFKTFIYGKGLVLREDGRMHPQYSTKRTGRYGTSPNFQNWPLWMRRAIQAPEGFKLIGADYSQLELRIIAALSGDEELIRRCRDADENRKLEPDWDPHSYGASELFGDAFLELSLTDPDEKVRRKSLREIFKSVIYAINYGSGAATILESIYKKGYTGMPLNLQIIQQAMQVIFRVFPRIAEWRDNVLSEALRLGEVRSPLLNRWRTFPWGQVDAPIAWNFPIQSCGGDIMNLRTILYHRELKKLSPRSKIMVQVHDALYTISPEEDAERVAELKQEILSIDLQLVDGAPAMPFVATAKIGDTWDQVS